MKRYLLATLILLSWIFLSSCSSLSEVKLNQDLSRESWQPLIETNPLPWMRGSDLWFATGDAHAVDRVCNTASSTMKVNAPFFTRIKIRGNFKVQLFGTPGPNSVYVYGPTSAVSETMIMVRGNTLYLDQRQKTKAPMGQVVVRIGVNQLNELVQTGMGTVEGIRINSNCLSVISTGCGDIYLAGHMNLVKVLNLNRSNINIFGAESPELAIRTAGAGHTNISGLVGVKSIFHQGTGNINIIGANSNCLKIYADGRGKIGISGMVNLYSLQANGQVCVLVNGVASPYLHVVASDAAKVGLAGAVREVHIEGYNRAFVGAQRLCAEQAFVDTSYMAHVNITATRKIFATASGYSSIYFFGRKEILTKFTSDSGFVLQMCTACNYCPMPAPVLPAPPMVRVPIMKPVPHRLRGEG